MSPESLEQPRMSSPEEELDFLRTETQRKEQAAAEAGEQAPHERRSEYAREAIEEYTEQVPEQALAARFQISESEADEIVLHLEPETHDDRMAELLSIVQEKGVRNALSVVEKMNNPHLADDFHRVLSEYVREGYDISGVREREPLWQAIHMTLYEVSLPAATEDDSKTVKDLLAAMEQFYSGMLSVASDKSAAQRYFALEMAVANDSEELVFYVAVPNSKQRLLESHILSTFPRARIQVHKEDYNIFNYDGYAAGAYAQLDRHDALPLKTYDQFEYDPFNTLLSSFSDLKKDGEGAAVQFIISPAASEYYRDQLQMISRQVEKGIDLDQLELSVGGSIGRELAEAGGTLAKELTSSMKDMILGTKSNKQQSNEQREVDRDVVERVNTKSLSPVVATNVRILTAAKSSERARAILGDIEASFNQFEDPQGNRLRFTEQTGSRLTELSKQYAFRVFSQKRAVPLNLRELVGLYHLTAAGITSSRELKQTASTREPAPVDMPEDGAVIGVNRYRSSETHIHFAPEDRLRHLYTIGQTGTGKTTLLKNIIAQDIQDGHGVCMIDPHGTDIEDILSYIPKERADDVIYFDPGYTARPMGLNLLEYDREKQEQKTFVVNEMFNIFQKLFSAVPESMGPMFEQYFRNATTLVIEDPDSGNTLLDVSRVLADKDYRDYKLSRCSNPVVKQFWEDVAGKAGGEASLQNIVPYITSKFDVFLSNEIMRPIIGQEQSAFNFKEVMDNRKILLVNLSKGKLGDINAHLIGLIIVGKILMSALARVEDGRDAPPFYLFIDEFQNVTTDSISSILSEARKYKLGLNVAHQYIAQLDEGIRDAVFGNVGSMVTFRVGNDDANFLEHQFEPTFTAQDIMNLENRNAYVSMLANGSPVKPFNIETLPPPAGDEQWAHELKQQSYERFGRPREEVEQEIARKYR
jgi:hypothetical protein